MLMLFCFLLQGGAAQPLRLRGAEVDGQQLLRADRFAARISALCRQSHAHGVLIQQRGWGE